MNRSRRVLSILIILVVPAVCFAQTPPQAGSSAGPAQEITIPSYPDTAQGLEKLMGDMMKLAKDGDTQTLAAYAKSLVLPNADNWFNVAFGATRGPGYAAASEQQRLGIVRSAPANFTVLLNGKKTRIETHKFENSCNEDATAKEYPLLIKRDSLVPLYDVRFWDNAGTGSIWAYFAYVDGGFRYVGDLPAQLPALRKKPAGEQDEATVAKPPLSRVRVGANVQQANLTHQVTPVYPQKAKSAHIQGTVLLHAVIGKDGHIQDLTLTEGVCLLSESAMDAVKDWRYRPTLINGDPVEVDTTISVIFKLGR